MRVSFQRTVLMEDAFFLPKFRGSRFPYVAERHSVTLRLLAEYALYDEAVGYAQGTCDLATSPKVRVPWERYQPLPGLVHWVIDEIRKYMHVADAHRKKREKAQVAILTVPSESQVVLHFIDLLAA